MAHSCPDCGSLCHCGGNIDDCCFENTPEERHCTHCPMDGMDDDLGDDFWNGMYDDDDDPGDGV